VNKLITFWIASSSVLFLLSLVYLHYQLHRKNPLFAWWLCLGVTMQLVTAYGMVLGNHRFLNYLWRAADIASILLALAVLGLAYARRSCPVNRTLLYGLGAMLAFDLVTRLTAGHLSLVKQTWLENIAFFGPAIFMLVSFSNIRLDRIPLYLCSFLGEMTLRASPSPGMAVSLLPVCLPQRQAARPTNDILLPCLTSRSSLRHQAPKFLRPSPGTWSADTSADETPRE